MNVAQFIQAAGYVLSAISGGIATELMRWLLHRGDKQADDATEIRNELRTDKAELRAELNKLRVEHTTLSKQFDELNLANARLEGHVKALSDENTNLRSENLGLKGENSALNTRVAIFEQVLAKLSGGAPLPTGPVSPLT